MKEEKIVREEVARGGTGKRSFVEPLTRKSCEKDESVGNGGPRVFEVVRKTREVVGELYVNEEG